MQRLALLASAAMAALAVAGCAGSTAEDAPPATVHPMDMAALHGAAAKAGADVPAAMAWWVDIATNYPKHDSNTPTNAALRDRIVSDMRALGFEVEVRSYPGAVSGRSLPSPVGEALPIDAIVARMVGTTFPDRAIALVSHYDTQAGTVMGAYDDASGVAAEFAICKALAEVPLQHTLDCIFFDAEERGLAASEAYVQDAVVEGNSDVAYSLVLGYDMVGLNWPGHTPWKLYLMVGENVVPSLHGPMRQLMHDPAALGYPEDGVEVLDVHDRNSDERNFKEAGIPILRFAGGRHAVDYPMYHRPGDTVQYVDLYAGSRANFEAGFAQVLEASLATILALDQVDLATHVPAVTE